MPSWREKQEFDTSGGMQPGVKYTGWQIEKFADDLLIEDTRRELCRKCSEYGEETGSVEPMPQFDEEGRPEVDEEDNQLVIDYVELQCKNGHRWYGGEGRRRGIDGKNPILFESHLTERRRREIFNVHGVPDPSIVSGLYNRCVDEETEALTPTGWKTYDELNVGDLILAYDIETDTSHWSPLTDLFKTLHFGPLAVFESQNISARVTEGHRWPVAHEADLSYRYDVKTTLERPARRQDVREDHGGRLVKQPDHEFLIDRHQVPLARKPLDQDHEGELDLWELAGWIVSDGGYKKDYPGRQGMTITQALHNKKMPLLDRVLVANGVDPTRYGVDENNVATWYINSDLGKRIRAFLPEKAIASLDLTVPTYGEALAFIRGLVYGDGSLLTTNAKTNVRAYFTTKKTEAAAFQALCASVGITTSCRERYDERAWCPLEYFIHLKETRGSWAYIRPARKSSEDYEGVVWCPTVDSGFWMARRNGKVYMTGNSHPEGRKVNTPEQRRASGASYYR